MLIPKSIKLVGGEVEGVEVKLSPPVRAMPMAKEQSDMQIDI